MSQKNVLIYYAGIPTDELRAIANEFSGQGLRAQYRAPGLFRGAEPCAKAVLLEESKLIQDAYERANIPCEVITLGGAEAEAAPEPDPAQVPEAAPADSAKAPEPKRKLDPPTQKVEPDGPRPPPAAKA